MNSVVYYSCLFGTREGLNPDLFVNVEGADKVLFTDRRDLRIPGVEVRFEESHGIDPGRASRRAKLMPHRYFPDHEISIYADNRVSPKPGLVQRTLSDAADPEVLFWALQHPWRDCTHAEAHACVKTGAAPRDEVLRQLDHYTSLGLPRQNGLIAATFLLRRHHAGVLPEFGDRWFEHVLRFSRRDQIAWGYLAWAMQLEAGRLEGDLTDNELFTWIKRAPFDEASIAPALDRQRKEPSRLQKLLQPFARRSAKSDRGGLGRGQLAPGGLKEPESLREVGRSTHFPG